MVSSVSSSLYSNGEFISNAVKAPFGEVPLFTRVQNILDMPKVDVSSIFNASSASTLPTATQAATTVAEASNAASVASCVSSNVAKVGAGLVAGNNTALKNPSILSKIFNFFIGDWTDDVGAAFKNRHKVPFKFSEAYNNAISKQTANVTANALGQTPKAGIMGKIGNAITKACPFLKNSKISKIFGFASKNVTSLLVYGMSAFQIFNAWRKYGIAEAGKETIKMGIVTACMIGLKFAATALLPTPFAFPASIIGIVLGTWLGNKCLGMSAHEKEQIVKAQQQQQQQQQLAQTNGSTQQQSNTSTMTPQQKDQFASQFGNPNQITSLGRFGDLANKVDPGFAQMVVRHDALYNPLQNIQLQEQIQREMAMLGIG